MFTYSFTVDQNLNILSWDRNLETIRSDAFCMVAGVPYFHVLPRLWQQGGDAVAHVIACGTSMHVRDYPVACFYEAGTMDLAIRPIVKDGNVSGAEVKLSSYAGCTTSHRLQRSQSLVHMGKFSTTLAHGVRNPLNAIKGAAVYLNEKYSEESTLQEFISIIDEEIEKLDYFITRFLSNSLVELQVSPVSIGRVLEKVVTLCTLQTYSRNIRFICDYADIPDIDADSFLIEHAILNVMNNSIESLRKGGEVLIKTRLQSPEANLFFIEISHSRPFPMERGAEAMISEKTGTKEIASRLFITREIVQLHGGYVEISNDKDRGSIRINLPVER